VFVAEIDAAAGADARLQDAAVALRKELTELSEATARRTVERMALALQGALLATHGHPAVADAFAATRLRGDWGQAFGTLPAGVDSAAILARTLPVLS
jgi:putative acyl-CoA dehydrogenase